MNTNQEKDKCEIKKYLEHLSFEIKNNNLDDKIKIKG